MQALPSRLGHSRKKKNTLSIAGPANGVSIWWERTKASRTGRPGGPRPKLACGRHPGQTDGRYFDKGLSKKTHQQPFENALPGS